MRKLFTALAVMLFMAGLVLASDGTLTKVDVEGKKITIKDKDDKETEYKFTDKVKVTLVTGKKGEEKESEGKYEDWEKQLKAFKADAKFGNKITFESKDGEVTEVKVRSFGKKTKD